MDRRSCGVVSHAVQATRAAADLERFASFRRGPPAAGSPRLAGPSSQASWFEAWNLTVSSLELVKLEPGACQVEAWTLASSSLELQFRAWMLSTGGLGFAKFQAGTCQVGALGLSGGGSEVVKFEPGSWQVEALNLTTLGCSWFAPLSLRRALPWPALSASKATNPRFLEPGHGFRGACAS